MKGQNYEKPDMEVMVFGEDDITTTLTLSGSDGGDDGDFDYNRTRSMWW